MPSGNLTSDGHINFIAVTGVGKSDTKPKGKGKKDKLRTDDKLIIMVGL